MPVPSAIHSLPGFRREVAAVDQQPPKSVRTFTADYEPGAGTNSLYLSTRAARDPS